MEDGEGVAERSRPVPLPGMSVEEAFRVILLDCVAEIDAHLAQVLDRDDPEGPHRARVWLRRLVGAFDAFRPVLKRGALRELRAEAKAIFRLLGMLRDRDVLIAGLPEGAQPMARTAAAPLHDKVRARLRARNAVLFAPLLLRRADEGALFRSGARATAIALGPVDRLAKSALDRAWRRCRDRRGTLPALAAPDLHGFRKDLKTLRYLSEFFAPFLPSERSEPFRAAMQELQDLLGIATDAEMARLARAGAKPAKGKRSEGGKAGRRAVAQAIARADALWQDIARVRPWWRDRPDPALVH